MGKCISFGNFNKNYKYMILYLIFRASNDCINGFGYKDLYGDTYFFGDDAQKLFTNHALINTIFCYIGIIIFSIIVFIIKYELCLKDS